MKINKFVSGKINKAKLEEIRNRHNLSLIIMHGSNIDKKTHLKSDVDIAVVRKDGKKKLNLLKLIKDLVKVFKKGNIDVSDLTHADPLFLYSVLQKSKLLSGETKDYDALLELAFHKYSDYLPYLEEEKKFVKERIKSYVSD